MPGETRVLSPPGANDEIVPCSDEVARTTISRRSVVAGGLVLLGAAALGTVARPAMAAGQWGNWPNGEIPSSALRAISWNGMLLESNAAVAIEALNKKYVAAFGENLPMTGTYRSLERQTSMFYERYQRTPISGAVTKSWQGTTWYLKPGFAMSATPGQSNHGWGHAIDFSQPIRFGTPERDWLVRVGPQHGWVSPEWAHNGGKDDESWHFEYTGAGAPASPGSDPDSIPTVFLEDEDMKLIKAAGAPTIYAVSTHNIEPVASMEHLSILQVFYGPYVEISAVDFARIRDQINANIVSFARSMKGQGL